MIVLTSGKSRYSYFYRRLRASNGQWLPPFQRLEESPDWKAAYTSYFYNQQMRFSGVVK